MFSGEPGGVRKFPYPVATAFLQLGVVSLILGIVNILRYITRRPQDAASWIFGPHFGYKVRHIAPVGVLFGFKYGITNWGLQLMPVPMHLLLQSTDLVWTVIFARILNKERHSFLEYLAAVLSTIGSCMISMRAVQSLEAPVLPLLVNLLTPPMLALCVCTLRKGAAELSRPDNRLEGGVTPIEFTSLKLAMSSACALLLSLCLEGDLFHIRQGAPWWVSIQHEPMQSLGLLMVGSMFVLIFQVNLTWLSSLTSAVTVGIMGGVKVIPQWALNAAFSLHVDLVPLSLGGAALILLASGMYAHVSVRKYEDPADMPHQLSEGLLFVREVTP